MFQLLVFPACPLGSSAACGDCRGALAGAGVPGWVRQALAAPMRSCCRDAAAYGGVHRSPQILPGLDHAHSCTAGTAGGAVSSSHGWDEAGSRWQWLSGTAYSPDATCGVASLCLSFLASTLRSLMLIFLKGQKHLLVFGKHLGSKSVVPAASPSPCYRLTAVEAS